MDAPTNKVKTSRPRVKAGRPTAEEARLREQRLLETALDLFLERGFDGTTVEDIATAASMSKRTVYSRHEDKSALFRAAVMQAIERYTVPPETLAGIDRSDLEAALKEVGRIRICNMATPSSVQLQRILTAQSFRFPGLFDAAFIQGVLPTIDFLVDLFEQHSREGEISLEDPDYAARAFLSLVAGGPTRLMVSGHTLDNAKMERGIDLSVRLFLNGIRSRQ